MILVGYTSFSPERLFFYDLLDLPAGIPLRLLEHYAEHDTAGLPDPSTAIDLESTDQAFINAVRGVILQHLSNPDLSVEMLAEAVGLSRSTLHRRFTTLCDETPAGLIKRMRLERAAILLRQQAGNVSETAYATGFKSLAHFSTSFRSHFGCTPTAYRAADIGSTA